MNLAWHQFTVTSSFQRGGIDNAFGCSYLQLPVVIDSKVLVGDNKGIQLHRLSYSQCQMTASGSIIGVERNLIVGVCTKFHSRSLCTHIHSEVTCDGLIGLEHHLADNHLTVCLTHRCRRTTQGEANGGGERSVGEVHFIAIGHLLADCSHEACVHVGISLFVIQLHLITLHVGHCEAEYGANNTGFVSRINRIEIGSVILTPLNTHRTSLVQAGSIVLCGSRYRNLVLSGIATVQALGRGDKHLVAIHPIDGEGVVVLITVDGAGNIILVERNAKLHLRTWCRGGTFGHVLLIAGNQSQQGEAEKIIIRSHNGIYIMYEV